MSNPTAIFHPLRADKSQGKSRYVFYSNIIVFYLTLIILIGFLIYAVYKPNEFFHSKWVFFPVFLFYSVLFQYVLSRPPLPHQFKKSFQYKMTYRLTEEELIVSFANRPIFKKNFTEIHHVEFLQKKLESVASIRTLGKEFFVSYEDIISSSKEFPNLRVYSTSLQDGILIHCSNEVILLTPEDKSQFYEELKKRIASVKLR